jgi:hypothetical protein
VGPKIRGVQVSQIDAPLRVVDLPQPRPGAGQVRIAVTFLASDDASGIDGFDLQVGAGPAQI